MRITLPWPDAALSPNARAHYRAKARAVASYRRAAGWATVAAGPVRFDDVPLLLDVTFSPPDARQRDLDNMLASIKAGIDGIADVLGLDDYRFSYAIRRAEPVKGGRVTVEITQKED